MEDTEIGHCPKTKVIIISIKNSFHQVLDRINNFNFKMTWRKTPLAYRVETITLFKIF